MKSRSRLERGCDVRDSSRKNDVFSDEDTVKNVAFWWEIYQIVTSFTVTSLEVTLFMRKLPSWPQSLALNESEIL